MSRLSFSLTDAPAPDAAVDMNGSRITGIRLDHRGGRPSIVSHATEALPDQALVPALNAANVRDRAAVAGALERVLDRIGRPRRIGVIVGDPAVKVSLVKLQQVPSRQQDLEQVIRWQVRKSAPFSIDDAQVGFEPGLRADDGQEFLVTVARRDVIAEYEGLCADAGAHAGIVDLSTFNVINMVLASGSVPAGDWLLVNVAPGWESIAILRGAHIIFFRNRGADGEGTLADLVHQTAMYYEDRLQGTGFARVMLRGSIEAGGADALRRSLAERLGTAVETVDATRVVGFPERAGAAVADGLAPAIGLVLRTREVA